MKFLVTVSGTYVNGNLMSEGDSECTDDLGDSRKSMNTIVPFL